MSLTIEIIRDDISPTLRQAVAGLSGSGRVGAHQVAGRAVRNLLVKHFTALDQSRPNKLGGERTHFYRDCAKATHFTATEESAVVGVSQIGIAQRRFGGTITARNSKFLTIPATAEAYGHRAREFNDLRFAILGGKPALIQAEASEVRFGKRGAKHTASRIGKVFYWLARSVNQQPDPTVLPTDQEFTDTISKETTTYVLRLFNK